MAEETLPQAPVQDDPYIDRVYMALKDNLSGFNKTPEQFKTAMKDSGYASKAYTALKDNLSGFNKSEDEFYSQVGLKKKPTLKGFPNGVDLSGRGLTNFQSTQAPTELTPVMPEKRAEVKQRQVQDAKQTFPSLEELRAQGQPSMMGDNTTVQPNVRLQNIKQSIKYDKNASSKYVANAPLAGTGSLASGIQDIMANLLGGLGVKDGAEFEQMIKGVRESNNELREAPEKVLGFDISKKDRDIASQEFLTGAFRGLGESIPAMMTPSGSGLYLQAYDNGIKQINNTPEGAKLPEWAKTTYGGTVGLAQGALEKVGLSKIIKSPKLLNTVTNKIINKVFGGALKSGEKLTAETAEKLINKEVSALSAKVRQVGAKALSGFAVETGTGTAQETAQVLTEIATNQVTGKEIFDIPSFGEAVGRIAKSGLQEGVGGFVMGGGAGALGGTEATIRNEVAKANPQELQQVSDEITNEIANDETLSEDDKASLLAKVKQYQEIATTIPETVAPEQKAEVIDHIVTRNDIDGAIEQKTAEMEAIDEAFKPQIQNEIDVLNDQRKTVDKDIQEVLTREPVEEIIVEEPVLEEAQPKSIDEQVNNPNWETEDFDGWEKYRVDLEKKIFNEAIDENLTSEENINRVMEALKPEYDAIRQIIGDETIANDYIEAVEIGSEKRANKIRRGLSDEQQSLLFNHINEEDFADNKTFKDMVEFANSGHTDEQLIHRLGFLLTSPKELSDVKNRVLAKEYLTELMKNGYDQKDIVQKAASFMVSRGNAAENVTELISDSLEKFGKKSQTTIDEPTITNTETTADVQSEPAQSNIEAQDSVEVAETPVTEEVAKTIAPFKLGEQDEFYHASPTKRVGRLKPGSAPQFGEGVYLSTNKDLVIDEFGKELTKVSLNIEKPLYTTGKEYSAVLDKAAENWNRDNLTYDKEAGEWIDKKGRDVSPADFGEIGERIPVKYLSDAAKELGYDAIIDKDSETYENEIVVLDESKINYKDDAPIIEDKSPNNPIRQKAIDAITHGIIGDGERKKGDVSPRFDLGMDTRDQKRAIRDITNGNYDTAVAKQMIDKVAEFEAKGEYPIIEGLGGASIRNRFATAEEIQQSIDAAKQFKLAKEQDIELNNKQLKGQDLTHDDFENYYRHRAEELERTGEPDNERATGSTPKDAQRTKDDQKASKPSDTGSKTTQGEPKAGDPLRVFADKVRAGKISKLGGFKAGTGFDAVWDASLEVVATAAEGGAKLADAIEAGLKHIKSTEWYKNLSDKEKFDTEYRRHLKNEFTATEKEMTGITHEQTKKSREEVGLPEYEKITKDDAELNAQADKALKDGYNVADLIVKMEEGALPKDFEQVILRRFLSSVSAEIAENPTAENLSLYKRALDVSDKIGGSELARSLAARRGLVVKENNLANFIYDEMAAFGVNKLPKGAIEQLKTEFEQAQELQQKYEEGYQKALDDLNAKKAKSSIDRTRASIPKTRPTKVELATERKAIVKDMRAALLKATKGGYGAMSAIPYAAQLRAIAPYVPKLVRNLVADGKVRIEDVVKSIHEELKDFIEDITEKDVSDLIAGQYREKRGRNEINAQIRDLQTQAKLLAKISDLEQGIKKAKNIGEEVRKSKEVEELQKRVKEIELRNIELFGPEDNTMTPEQRLATKQATIKSELAKAKYELENSTFEEVPPPEKLVLDPETRKYQDELIEIRKKIKLRRDKAYYDRLPKWERAWDKFTQIAGLRRLVQTAFDLSMPFRQGIAVTLNPRAYGIGLKNITSLKGLLNTPKDVRNSIAIKSWENMFKTVFSQKNYDRMMFEMEQTPEYKDMIDDNLHFNDVESFDNNNRNEDFRSSFIYEIPYLRAPLLASNRAAAGFINTARYEIYLKGKKILERQGITRENSPENYTELAKWAMNVTGRGNFHKALENNPTAQRVLGNTFFGARLMASRFNLTNPKYYYKLPKGIREEIWKDVGAYATMAVITMLAAQAAGASVSMDPDDADFGKAKWGNKRYDIVSGGIAQYIRTYLRIAKAIYMRANPNVAKEEGKKYAKFALMSTGAFLQYKLAPNTSYALSAFTGKDAIGKDFNATDIAKIYPMYVDDLVESWKEDGPTSGMTILLPSIVGMGVQNYENETTEERRANDAIKRLKLPNDGAEYELNEEQIKEREKINAEYINKNKKRFQSAFEKRATVDKVLLKKIKEKTKDENSENRKKIIKELVDAYVQKKIAAAANKYSMPIIYRKYKDKLTPVED